MFLEHQIIILEGFLKDHVTLETGVMMLKITGINWILQYFINIAVFRPYIKKDF